MTDKTEGNYLGDLVRWEMENYYSRTTGTIKSGAGVLKIGTVLGKILLGAATSAAKAGGNTGTGTLTMDATHPVRNGAKAGVYTVRFTVAATNNGTFVVEDPDGNQIGAVVMAGGAGAFDDDIKFAIADGGTDFAVGDGFDITVAAGSFKYVKAAYGAEDGTQNGAAILLQDVDASAADVSSVLMLDGPAQVAEAYLIYDASADNGTKKDALKAGLAAKGIKFLKSA